MFRSQGVTIRGVSELVAPVEEQPSDLAQAGRDAHARHLWQEAFDLLTRADAETPLSGGDLEILADAAFFVGRGDARIGALERAFKAHQATGDDVRAAFVATYLATNLAIKGKTSMASAWARRAEPLLAGKPESYAHGALTVVQSEVARHGGDVARATELATEAVAIAERTGDADLRARALSTLATLRIASGQTGEGFRLLEEAAIAAVNDELSPIIAGMTSCTMIAACRNLTDYRRASEWLEATDKWCERQEVAAFPGVCRIHRAEIVALRGGWDRAETELRQAAADLEGFDATPPLADGLYALGDIRRLKGDVDGAEEALRQAHALGRSPQPALALLRLGAGNVNAASSAIDAALAEASWDQWARVRLLAAQAEIAIAAGNPARARAAVDELTQIVSGYPMPALEAGRRQAEGLVLLAEGDAAGAVRELRAAQALWRDVGAPYEIARARAALSRALRELGNDDDADLELRAARDEFERLGAAPDLEAVAREERAVQERRSARVQVRMTFLFTDIVGSTNLAEALGDEAWERMLGWHDDALRGLFGRHRGRVVNSTGDGFFVAFESARDGIACAIGIQRELAEHRTRTGFAPPVRIGLHSADATRRGDDFSGVGVHVAARVAALAGGGEILVSGETLADAGDVATAESREVSVKGVNAPIIVAAVNWS
jgi:class 3 adenylate cyclase